MTARSHATEIDASTRIVRVGPRLPPGARVRVRTIDNPDPEWEVQDARLQRRRDDEYDADDGFGRAPRLGDYVEIAIHGWWRRKIVDDAITHCGFTPGSPVLARFVVDGDEEDEAEAGEEAYDDAIDACPCVGIEAVVLTMVPGEIVGVAVPSGGGVFMPDPMGECPSDEYYEWVVELDHVERAVKPDITAPFEECLAYANEKRRRGNVTFTNGEYARALRRYEEAGEVLERARMTTRTPKEASAAKESLVVVHVNAATALAKMSRFQEVKTRCDRALEIDGKSAKAMYRKALASESLGECDEALEILTEAMRVSNDKAIRDSFVRVRRAVTVTTKKEKDVYAKMMQPSGDDDDSGKDDEMKNRNADARKIETRREGDSTTRRLAFWARERPIVAGALCLACVATAAHYFRRKDSASTSTSTDARID